MRVDNPLRLGLADCDLEALSSTIKYFFLSCLTCCGMYMLFIQARLNTAVDNGHLLCGCVWV